MTRSWRQQLCKASQHYFIVKASAVVIVNALLIFNIIAAPTSLQPALGTTFNLPPNNARTYINNTDYETFTLVPSNQSSTSTLLGKTNVTLTGLFGGLEDSKFKWNTFFQPALDELNRRHPDMNIQLKYDNSLHYNKTRNLILDRLSNGNNSVDIMTLDQIWLGDIAEKGLLRNLTGDFEKWNGSSDLYESIIDGQVYNNTVYSLWLWTAVRGMWYWKDMLQQAGVDPESLKTWDGYISAGVKLKEFFGDRINQGVHLVGASHDPDMWYPYLWMLGGDILELRDGHPTKGVYWFPSYNSSEGIKAMEFLKQQVDAGIEPQKEHYWGVEFANRSFPVMLEGSWAYREFPKESRPTMGEKVGFIPMFPVPNQTIPTSTMMGGWQLAIPSSSQHSDLAWEFMTIMAQPEILSPFLEETGSLPTQRTLGDGPASEPLRESIPYFDEMVSMIPYGRDRPNIAEYPAIAEDIHQAIQQVYNGSASPKEALDMAAAKSAATLGWK